MKNLALMFSVCALFYSCKKNDETPETPTPVTYDSYSNLKVGNYWVYERFNLDTVGGIYTSLNVFDSSYIEKDTVVNGNTYYKLMAINYPNTEYIGEYLRDSLSFIVNLTGSIVFASQNFTDTFYTHYYILNTGSSDDTVSYIYSKMADDNFSIEVPAGTFATKNYRTTYMMWPDFAMTGGAVRPINYRCAKDIGLVEQTLIFFAYAPDYTIRRLSRYGHS